MKQIVKWWDRIFRPKNKNVKTPDVSKIFMWLAVCYFAFTTAWILVAGHYAVPNQDDYYTGYEVYQSLREGNRVGAVEFVKQAADRTIDVYRTWGGNYTSPFFCALQIFVFNEDYYQFEVLFILAIVVAGLFFFNNVLLKGFSELSRESRITLNMLFITLALQFVPSPYEAYYWFVGSFYNTCGLAFGAAVIGMLISYKRKPAVYKLIIAVVLAVLSGGCNYSSFLVQLLVMALYLLDLYADKAVSLKVKVPVTLVSLFWLACSLLSILAPGNAERGQYSEGYGFVKAILYSFAYAADFAIQNFSAAILIFLVLLAVLVTPSLKKSEFQFKNPILVLLLSFGILASCFTPTLYAQAEKGQPRVFNIIFWYYLFMLCFMTVYLCGYHVKRAGHKDFLRTESVKKLIPALILLTLVSTVCISKEPVWLKAEEGFFDTTLMSFKGLMDEREDFYKAHVGEDVVVSEIPIPTVFEGLKEIEEEPSYWINDSVCTYYGIKSVRMDRSLPIGTLRVLTE